MGASAKKALKKELNKILSSTPLSDKQKSSSGFLVGDVQSVPDKIKFNLE